MVIFHSYDISGWWFQPLWKIWKSVGMTIPNIWKETCSNHQPDIQEMRTLGATNGSFATTDHSLSQWHRRQTQAKIGRFCQFCRCGVFGQTSHRGSAKFLALAHRNQNIARKFDVHFWRSSPIVTLHITNKLLEVQFGLEILSWYGDLPLQFYVWMYLSFKVQLIRSWNWHPSPWIIHWLIQHPIFSDITPLSHRTSFFLPATFGDSREGFLWSDQWADQWPKMVVACLVLTTLWRNQDTP